MIVIVKVSARRWMVIDAPTVESAWRSTAEGHHQGNPDDRPGYIYGTGEVIAGPADWTTCDLAAMAHAKRIGKVRTAAEHDADQQKRAEVIKQANVEIQAARKLMRGELLMDPNANLAEQSRCTDPGRLRELRQALLEWIARGGFEPDWTKYPEAAEDFNAWAKRYVP